MRENGINIKITLTLQKVIYYPKKKKKKIDFGLCIPSKHTRLSHGWPVTRLHPPHSKINWSKT